MYVIGVIGKMGSGKSTVAHILLEKHNFVSIAVADPLKRIVQEMFDIPGECLWGPSEARTGQIREMLQKLGTDYGRYFDEDLWANKLHNRIKSLRQKKVDPFFPDYVFTNPGMNVVVSDIRFPNEAKVIRSLGGTLCKVVRDVVPQRDATDHHISETAMDNIRYDYTIINNGSLEDLENAVDAVMRTVKGEVE